jgi:predicted enzyme related to lactoylglutathione lyase
MHFLVNLDVDDLENGIRFYGSAFGLSVGRRFGRFGVEMLGSSAASAVLNLIALISLIWSVAARDE